MRAILKQIRYGLQEDCAILAGAFSIWLLLTGLLALKGVPPAPISSNADNFIVYLAAFFVFFLLPLAGARLYRDRPESPIRYLCSLATASSKASAVWRGMPIFLAMILFMPAFSAMKSAIPLFNPYTWDPTWIAADRAIFGTDAWRFLQPVFGYPLITSILSLFYHLWILLIYVGGIYFALFASDRSLRKRYFIAFFAIWSVIGVGLATLFASVGPCFDWPILGIPTFLDQMRYLNAADERYPVMVLKVQQTLIDGYRVNNPGLGRGITAMPSMHVAQAFTFFLAMRHLSWKLGVASGLLTVIVFIGSIHLAYHYAMDGIVAAAASLVIWKVAGLLAGLPRLSKPVSRPGELGLTLAPENFEAPPR